MIISDKWTCYREDDVGKVRYVKELVVGDVWWDKIDNILSFITPIYDMIWVCETDAPTLHLVYDKYDTMIERV